MDSNAAHMVNHIENLGYILKRMDLSNNSVVALVSNSTKMQNYFQIACLLSGTNYVILSEKTFDDFIIVNLGISVIFTDTTNWLNTRSIFEFNNTFVNLVINVYSYRIEFYKESISNYVKQLESTIEKVDYSIFSRDKSRESLINALKESCVDEFNHSVIYAVHPGNSSALPKISIFSESQLYEGALKVIDELYFSIEDEGMLKDEHSVHPTITVQTLTEKPVPYVLLNTFILALISKGDFTGKLTENGYNTLFISTTKLKEIFNEVIEDSRLLSLLKRISLRILFKPIFKHRVLKKSKDLKLLMLYDNTSKPLRRLINYLNLKVVYMYTLTEVASFVSFQIYNKFPIKKLPNVGSIPRKVVLNTSDITKKEMSEILISLPDMFIGYTHNEFTQLCSMSDKYVGMHGTLDMGSDDKGKLVVHGKAEGFYYNENGLVFQNELIYSIILDNRFVRDALLVSHDNKLKLIVELRLGTLLFERTSASEAMEELNRKVLPKINKKVAPFSTVEGIYFIPNGFKRLSDGGIKTINFLDYN